jgi:4'-phosphopantetheinyl transferase
LFLARFSGADLDEWVDAGEAWLTSFELTRARGLGHPLRLQHVIGRAVMRLVVAAQTGDEPREVQIMLSPDGKPTLADHPDLHVNVSHSGTLVAVASSSTAPVGVDLETDFATEFSTSQLAYRVYSAQEAAWLSALAEPQARREFVRCWTIKEAVAKAIGLSLMQALAGVVLEPEGENLRLVRVAQGPPPERWTIHQHEVDDGDEMLAVALPSPAIGIPVPCKLDRVALASGRLPC